MLHILTWLSVVVFALVYAYLTWQVRRVMQGLVAAAAVGPRAVIRLQAESEAAAANKSGLQRALDSIFYVSLVLCLVDGFIYGQWLPLLGYGVVCVVWLVAVAVITIITNNECAHYGS